MSWSLKVKTVALDSSSRSGNNRAHSMEFLVNTGGVKSNSVAVCQWIVENNALPLDLSAYEPTQGGSIFLQTFTIPPQQDKNELIHFAGTATYARKTSTQAEEDVSWTGTQINFGDAEYEEVVEVAKDKDGKTVPVLNSAGDAFDPPLMEVSKRQVIFITKTYTSSQILPYTFNRLYNSVNRNAMTIADVPLVSRGAWMTSLRPTIRKQSASVYDWKIEFEIEVKGNNERYDRQVLDRGFSYLELLNDYYSGAIRKPGDASKWYRRVIVQEQTSTGEQKQSTSPVLLDGNGGLLKDTSKPIFLVYRTKPEVPWESLSLPRNIEVSD